jgi:hypothetical protein
MPPEEISREQVLAFRVHAQELDRGPGRRPDAAVLDLGVQDTGPDGARWALALRGAAPDPEDLFLAWTLRGAPHAYRRSQAAAVARAVAPVSEADAAKRVFDASRPLKQAGIPVLDALDRIAGEMRDIVSTPVVKGAMSTELHRRLPEPYQRWCEPCQAVHLYEQPFRLAALRGGLELRPGTSPPVLERIKGWRGPAARVDPALDPVRAVLRFLGPATPKQVAEYVDAPVREVQAHWPDDVVPVAVDGEERWILSDDHAALRSPPDVSDVLALLGPFDLFLQSRDRPTVVPDEADRKDLWRVLGRPGGVLVGHEVLGSWRPRASGTKLRVAVNAWAPLPDLTAAAERLARFRGLSFDGFVDA